MRDQAKPENNKDKIEGSRKPEISVVIPCLNEQDAISSCVKEALEGIRLAETTGEVIVRQWFY